MLLFLCVDGNIDLKSTGGAAWPAAMGFEGAAVDLVTTARYTAGEKKWDVHFCGFMSFSESERLTFDADSLQVETQNPKVRGGFPTSFVGASWLKCTILLL